MKSGKARETRRRETFQMTAFLNLLGVVCLLVGLVSGFTLMSEAQYVTHELAALLNSVLWVLWALCWFALANCSEKCAQTRLLRQITKDIGELAKRRRGKRPEKATEPAKTTEPEKHGGICPECGETVPWEQKRCGKCGTHSCPKCRVKISFAAHRCKKCGWKE